MFQYGDLKLDFFALLIIGVSICSVVHSIASAFKRGRDTEE